MLGPARHLSKGMEAKEDSNAESSLGRELRACVTGRWAVCAWCLYEGPGT